MSKLDDQIARDREILECHPLGSADLDVALHNFAESLMERMQATSADLNEDWARSSESGGLMLT